MAFLMDYYRKPRNRLLGCLKCEMPEFSDSADYPYRARTFKIPKRTESFRIEEDTWGPLRFVSRSWKDSYKCKHQYEKHSNSRR